ncbi:TonB-dependent siderophore receptor [Nostoc sp. FACHB-892]|uniref:TonB-dependent siderophore receptor n=1 Tax=Nostoc sp. FACHB-892 TaxID=2692843 RepID=UPI0016883231|nr:TonB-dependent siderophore receptor [Nostoc sp. FACHB-892]MBD2729527.1 TonB-dependent siderophore receptor [Nostoc sp. FACHB-892]
MKRWCLSVSVRLWFLLTLSGCLNAVAIGPGWAEIKPTGEKQEVQSQENKTLLTRKIRQLSEIERPSTSAIILVQSPAPQTVPSSEIVQVTGVQANPTDKGVEVILQTTQGEQLKISDRSTENNFIADIPNAQLRLPNGDGFTFRSQKPVEGITEITVINLDANTIRVTVAGEVGLPVVELFDDNAGLVFGINSAATATQPSQQPQTPQAQQPASETPQEQPAAQPDEPIELVVTGEQDGYRVTNTTTGTRTDTPLRDIPQSIQVVPQEVLRDQQVTRLEDAVRNVPGVNQSFNFGPITAFTIRGFTVTETNVLRDGLIDTMAGQVTELSSIERVEVLKGPASVLFGLGSPGGSINLVSKRPLSEPFYAIDATVGTYSYYRGAIDFSGPLDDSKTALYRLNVAYRNSDSFADFFNGGESLNISPVISVDIGERTNLILEGEYIKARESYPSGVPVIGSILSNPIGEVSRNRNFGEPSDKIELAITRLGYQLEHKFSDNWSLRNAFRFVYRDYTDLITLPGRLDADNRTFNRVDREYELENTYYALTTNLVGKFSTGSIQHQLLFGVDFNSSENLSPIYAEREANPIDIFNPVYGQAKRPGAAVLFESSDRSLTNSWGIYLQDQVTLSEGLKLLLGVRFDTFDRKYTDFITNTESSGSDSAFSPRFGIVYQPIPAISLYASYTSSFTPPDGTVFFGIDSTLQPERGNQYEVGVKADLSDRLSATLAFFDLTRTNVSTADPNREGFFIQVGEQNSQGIELNIAGEILPGWNIYAGYGYIDARTTEDTNLELVGKRLPDTATHSFNLWTRYEIQQGQLQGLGAGLGLFFVGDRAGDLTNTYDVPSYVRTDAAIFYNRERFRVALNFKNLFDVNYFESALNSNRVYYGQPFTLQGTVSWQF